MADNSALNASTIEGIDACRPGSDDLRLPELADIAREVAENPQAARRFEAVQRCDSLLSTAMYDVTVPENLAARILDRLNVSRPLDAESPALVELAEVPVSASSVRRSWWPVVVAASLLVAASGLLAWKWQPSGNVDVVTLTEVWQTELTGEWRSMDSAPKRLAPPRLSVSPRRWQPTSAYQGYAGVAYDVSRPGTRAVLFIVNVAPNGTLPAVPPMSPQFSAGGRAVAAWLSGRKLCLLVVDGDERAYRNLIRAGQVPLA